MTEKPKPCRYDRALGYRVEKGEHLDTCPDQTAHVGCIPCVAGHCTVCGRNHTTDQHPQTCVECIAAIREDLSEIVDLCRHLRRQAVEAEGLAWASARIPGHAAMVAMGPSVLVEEVRVSREYARDHLRKDGRLRDQLPPLAVLADWQDRWSGWLGITATAMAARTPEIQARADWLGLDVDVAYRASIARASGFLDRHLTQIAQQRPSFVDGALVAPPEVGEFSRAIGGLRATLERLLHDEEDGEHGVNCFECGARLVRRIRDPKRCRHSTGAKRKLAAHLRARPDAQAELRRLDALPIEEFVLIDPDVIARLHVAARPASPAMLRAAKAPCGKCGPDQGGVADPRPGISWECPSCRKSYTPGEYATAVRRDLADRDFVTAGDNTEVPTLASFGWTDIVLAADAATTLVGHPVGIWALRKWVEREKVSACCEWVPGRRIPKLLVFWPDVADEAVAAVARAQAAAEAKGRRRLRELEEAAAEAAKDEKTTAEMTATAERMHA